jgi:hypothetical protein
MSQTLNEKLKLVLLPALCLMLSFTAHAQSNFYKVGLGGGVGLTQSFTDVQKHGTGTAIYGTADYYFTPFITLGIEGQMGQISGGDINTDPDHREFINSYKSATINAKVFLGNFIDYNSSKSANILKGLYIGGGMGLIKNAMKDSDIVRFKPGTDYRFPGKDLSYNLTIPVNIGLNLYFADGNGDYRYIFNFNFQSNVTIGEGLDGYNDSPVKFRNGNPDIYNFMSVGIKYNFGPVGLSKKTFRQP